VVITIQKVVPQTEKVSDSAEYAVDPHSYRRSVPRLESALGFRRVVAIVQRQLETNQKSIMTKYKELTKEYDRGKTSPSCSDKGP
jgi:hypothetical protein